MRGTWRHLLMEGLGLVADAAVGSAVGATQRRGVPSKHPPQHRRHHHVHREIAAHLHTITDTCSLICHITTCYYQCSNESTPMQATLGSGQVLNCSSTSVMAFQHSLFWHFSHNVRAMRRPAGTRKHPHCDKSFKAHPTHGLPKQGVSH
jgi:hypothetical protein